MSVSAQSTMRLSHKNGGPGVLISGIVWILAATTTYVDSFSTGILVFFVGGMLIHPVSLLISSKIKKEEVIPDKQLTRLAVFTLPILFGGLYLAYVMSQQQEALFFPIMAAAIGIRYLLFQKIYGIGSFVTLGATLIIIAIVATTQNTELALVPLAVGIVEIIFGIWITKLTTAD